MSKQWKTIEANVQRIENGFVANVTVASGYPERRSPWMFFASLGEAVDHCAALAKDEGELAKLMSRENADEDDDHPF